MSKLKKLIDKTFSENMKDKFVTGALVAGLTFTVGLGASDIFKLSNVLNQQSQYATMQQEFVKQALLQSDNERLAFSNNEGRNRLRDLTDTMKTVKASFTSDTSSSTKVELLKNAALEWTAKKGNIVSAEVIDSRIAEMKGSRVVNFSELNGLNAKVLDSEEKAFLLQVRAMHDDYEADKMSQETVAEIGKRFDREAMMSFFDREETVRDSIEDWKNKNGMDLLLVETEKEANELLQKIDDSEITIENKVRLLESYKNLHAALSESRTAHSETLSDLAEVDAAIQKAVENGSNASATEMLSEIDTAYEKYVNVKFDLGSDFAQQLN